MTRSATLRPRRAAAQRRSPGATAPLPSNGRLRGVIASRGLAVGHAVNLRAAEIAGRRSGRGVAHESAELERARGEVRARLEQLAQHSQATAREVIAAHLEFLDDWELVAAARRAIARGKSAAFAWRRAVRDSADTLRALGDPRMAERVDDLLDLESQVLLALAAKRPCVVRSTAGARDSDRRGSQALAARLAGCAASSRASVSRPAGRRRTSRFWPRRWACRRWWRSAPRCSTSRMAHGSCSTRSRGNSSIAPDQDGAGGGRADTGRCDSSASRPSARPRTIDCRTADGERIEVFANLGSLAEAQVAVAHGAEGCGLLRTEFLFLEREHAPDEDEQLQQYQAIADALERRPLIIRTLDIGGDKPIPYLPLPAEENPALGLRGVRTSLWRPDLLRVQLRAILRVQPAGQCRVLLPMITDPAEIRAVRRMLDEVRRELGHHGAACKSAR